MSDDAKRLWPRRDLSGMRAALDRVQALVGASSEPRLVRCGEIPDPPLPSPRERRRARRVVPVTVAPRRAT